MRFLHQTNRTGSPRIDPACSIGVQVSTTTQRFPRSAVLELYERELAYYHADEPYLTVEKCAERCAKLSLLLTQAQMV